MKKLMMKEDVVRISFIGLGILVLFLATSCSGGYVTRNGLLQDGHKELKASLVGDWRVIDKDFSVPGPIVYEFYKGEKGKFGLKVNGEEAVMERFDSVDGLSFTFHFKDKDQEENYVYGHFKSYAKSELIIYQGKTSDSNMKQVEASVSDNETFKVLSRVVVASNTKN